MNGRLLVAVLVAGAVILLLAGRSYRRGGKTARYPQGAQYGTWTSVKGGMRVPFFSTPWFYVFIVLVLGLWAYFGRGA